MLAAARTEEAVAVGWRSHWSVSDVEGGEGVADAIGGEVASPLARDDVSPSGITLMRDPTAPTRTKVPPR